VEKVLVPSLRSGQIVVMDTSVPTGPRNPIEEAFAKIKNLLGKAAVRSKGALIEAMGAALSAVTAEDVWGFFEHAGYRPTDHFL
jgi:hypothetical protein